MIFADYRGLTVEQDTEMRRALRNAGVDYKVVKNTLTKFAAEENGLEGLYPYGGTHVNGISDTDPVAPAKILNEYAKKFDKLELKAGVVEGRIDVDGSRPWLNCRRGRTHRKGSWRLQRSHIRLCQCPQCNIRGLVVALNAIAEKGVRLNTVKQANII